MTQKQEQISTPSDLIARVEDIVQVEIGPLKTLCGGIGIKAWVGTKQTLDD